MTKGRRRLIIGEWRQMLLGIVFGTWLVTPVKKENR
jgi:hypothetical protein